MRGGQWILGLVASTLTACGGDQIPDVGEDGTGSHGSHSTAGAPSSDSDPTSPGDSDLGPDEPFLLCPSNGLGADSTLLVVGDRERTVIVRADGTTLELDGPPTPGLIPDSLYSSFTVTTGGIAVKTQWSDPQGQWRVQAFDLEGSELWALDRPRPEVRTTGGTVSPDGERLVVQVEDELVIVSDEGTRAYPGMQLFVPGPGPRLPAIEFGDPTSHESVGWLDLDTGVYAPSATQGAVTLRDGRLVGFDCYPLTHIQIASEDGTLLDFPVPDDLGCLSGYGWAGHQGIAVDTYAFETIARIDLDKGTTTFDSVAPPPGWSTLRCGWPNLTETGDALFPLTNGAVIQLMRLSPEGVWTETSATPMTGVGGALTRAAGDSVALSGFMDSNPCPDEVPLPILDGTVQGYSLQLLRPSDGTHLAWANVEKRPTWVAFDVAGECAAWASAEGELTIVDMVNGTQQQLTVPTEQFAFPLPVDANLPVAYIYDE